MLGLAMTSVTGSTTNVGFETTVALHGVGGMGAGRGRDGAGYVRAGDGYARTGGGNAKSPQT